MNTEEKILSMLENLTGTVEKHGEVLVQIQQEQKQMRKEQQQMRDDITGIRLRLELDIEKRFDAVNEGIDAILAQMTPKRRVEEMEADITVLKTAVKMLTQEVAELKKAQ